MVGRGEALTKPEEARGWGPVVSGVLMALAEREGGSFVSISSSLISPSSLSDSTVLDESEPWVGGR
jgi:hypothetical protein